LDSNKFAVRQALQTIARKLFQHHCLQTATSSTKADKFYKPGGTLLLAQGDTVGRIKERGSDSLGRWAWMRLIGRDLGLSSMCASHKQNGYHLLSSTRKSIASERGQESETTKILLPRS
jgi:hypothetical protein